MDAGADPSLNSENPLLPKPSSATSSPTTTPGARSPPAAAPPDRIPSPAAAPLLLGNTVENEGGTVNCCCKKSRCEKLYCKCYAAGRYCSETCTCQPCFNRPLSGEPVHYVPRNIWQTKSPGFSPKVVLTADANGKGDPNKSPASSQQRKGCCRCSKSTCVKKYCECFQYRNGCSVNCKCKTCMNPFGRRGGPINLAFMGESDENSSSSEDEEDDVVTACSPPRQSPFSISYSFQHGTQENLKSPVVYQPNRFYPQPLAQRQPLLLPGPKRHKDEQMIDVDVRHKTQADHHIVMKERDPYAISNCIDVLNRMVELSKQEKALAPDIFLEPSNREIFVSLTPDIRALWLRRKIMQFS